MFIYFGSRVDFSISWLEWPYSSKAHKIETNFIDGGLPPLPKFLITFFGNSIGRVLLYYWP